MILVFLVINSIAVQPKYYTNTNYVYELTGKDSIIYGATNGGIVAYRTLQGTFSVLTNSDGLQINQQKSIGLDSSGYIWIGSEMGLAVISQDLSDIYMYPVECLTCNRIQEIVCRQDSIFIGSSSGLLFIETMGTPVDFEDDSTWKIFEQNGLPSDDVRTIAVDDTLVWIGTASESIVHFNRDFTNPVMYAVPGNQVNKIAIIDSVVYAGTDMGLYSFQGDHFDTVLVDFEIIDINSLGDSLALALDSVSQFGFYYQGTFTLANNGIPYRCKVLSLLNISDNFFCGLGNRYSNDYFGEGLGRYDDVGTVWDITRNQSLPSNHISEITANEQGIFVACGARASESRGFGWFDNDGHWINFTRDSIIPSNHIHRCTTAPDGKVWFGVNPFPDDTSSVMVFSFDPPDEWNFIKNRYRGTEGTNAVWDIELDNDNNIYLALAGPTDKLWVIDSALESPYFLGERSPGFNVEIAPDSSGKIWRTVTRAEGGLIMIDTRNTLFDRTDDSYRIYTESDGMLSKYAWGCTVDENNNLYVANAVGLLIYDGTGFSGITNISQEDYLDVELDTEGRIWIMARDGIYYYDPQLMITDGWSFNELGIHIEFPDEDINIQGFEFDPLRGCFWIGGKTGLLKLTVQVGTHQELDSIVIYPNPVVGHGFVRIKNLPMSSRVNIYTISGRKIAEDLEPDNVFGEVVWEIPEDIGSGLYFALVKSDYGKKVCKFALVR